MTTTEQILNLIPANQQVRVNNRWVNSRNYARKLIDNLIKEKLQEYPEFLMEYHYCDSDVVSEGNTAIDRFLNPKLRDK